MATTTTKATERKPAHGTSVDHLQDALRDLDKAREAAQGELRGQIDDARERVSEAIDDLRDRAGELRDWEGAMDRASDQLRAELGLRAVRAQRSSEALTEMSAAIRKRKAELARA